VRLHSCVHFVGLRLPHCTKLKDENTDLQKHLCVPHRSVPPVTHRLKERPAHSLMSHKDFIVNAAWLYFFLNGT